MTRRETQIWHNSKGDILGKVLWNYNEEGLIVGAEWHEKDELVDSIQIR